MSFVTEEKGSSLRPFHKGNNSSHGGNTLRFFLRTVPHRLIHLNARFSADGLFGQDYGCDTTAGDVPLRVGFKISKALAIPN